jgi:hypothetical protein
VEHINSVIPAFYLTFFIVGISASFALKLLTPQANSRRMSEGLLERNVSERLTFPVEGGEGEGAASCVLYEGCERVFDVGGLPLVLLGCSLRPLIKRVIKGPLANQS